MLIETSAFGSLPVITFRNTTFGAEYALQAIVCDSAETAKREVARLGCLPHVRDIQLHDAVVKAAEVGPFDPQPAFRDLCPLCGEDRNHPSQKIRGGHRC